MNVLLLSIGAKYSLVKFFKEPSSGFDKVITTDCNEMSAGLYASDKHYIVPRIKEPSYFPTILDICKKENISLIIPLNEIELTAISKKRDMFESEGILVALSSDEFVNMCKDKYLFCKSLETNSIPYVPTYDVKEDYEAIKKLPFPLYAKPRCGAGSVGNTKITSSSFLDEYIKACDEPLIIQPFIEFEEFGVDLYVDFVSKKIIQIFIKKKLSMRSGETEKSISVKSPEICALVEKIVDTYHPVGVIDIDIIKYNNEYHVLEINPRFGGGYPHAFACGANYPLYLKNNAEKKENTPSVGDYKEDVVALKYTSTLII